MKLLNFFILLKIVFLKNQKISKCFPVSKYPESCQYIDNISKIAAICIQDYYKRETFYHNKYQLIEEEKRTITKSKNFYRIKCRIDQILGRKDDYILIKKNIEYNINFLDELASSISEQSKNIEKYIEKNGVRKINKKILKIKNEIEKNTFLNDNLIKKIIYLLFLALFFVVIKIIINEIQIY
jgi:hypothetical protein